MTDHPATRDPERHDDGDAPPALGESLDIVSDAQRRARVELDPAEAPIWWAWGVAWILAFGLTFLAVEGTAPLAGLPPLVLGLLWPACIGGAVVFQFVYMGRRLRGRSGASIEQGNRVGMAYMGAFALAALMVPALGLVPTDLPQGSGPFAAWEVSMVFVLVLAVLYLMQGAMAGDRLMMVAGAWIGAVNIVAALIGTAVYGAALAVFGGGGMVVCGVVAARQQRRGG